MNVKNVKTFAYLSLVLRIVAGVQEKSQEKKILLAFSNLYSSHNSRFSRLEYEYY